MRRTLGALCLVLFAGRLLAGPSDSVFWVDNAGLEQTGPHRLTVAQRRVELAPITAAELVRAGDPDLGTQRRFAVAASGGLAWHGGMQLPPLKSMVRREIEGLWRLSLDADAAMLHGGDPVRVSLIAGDGIRAAEIDRIRVEPIVHETRHEGDGRQTIQGGVVLWLPIEVLDSTEALRFSLNIEADAY